VSASSDDPDATDCDHGLLTAYKDECNKQAKFLVKTHFPALGHQKDNHWASFDRAVHLVRKCVAVALSLS